MSALPLLFGEVDDVFLGVAIADPLSLVLKVRRRMGEEFLGGDVDHRAPISCVSGPAHRIVWSKFG